MSLQVWLPLTKDLRQQGLSNVTVTNNGATFSENGKLGGCYRFSTTGNGSNLSIPSNTMSNFTASNGCSLAFWIKLNTWYSSYATFFQAGTGSNPWSNYIFGVLRNATNSTVCFTIGNGSTASNNNYLTSAWETGVWFHMAFTYETGKCKIYKNGVLDKEYTTSIVPDFSKITKITVGRCNNDTSYQTDCEMNDFRIYDHCLSPMEVKELAKGLVLHYPLNRGGLGPSNLLKNGFGELGSENWDSGTNISTSDIPSGQSDIKASFSNGYAIERIKLYPTHTYKFSAWIKATTTSGYTYPSLYPYDVDGNFIDYHKCSDGFNLNTMTTLKQELKTGDTKIYVNDLSQWNANSGHYYNFAAIFSYTDGTGYTYPDGTYTQNLGRFGSSTTAKTNLDKTNNIITLTTAYTGPNMPVGTKLCASTEGSTFYYPLGGINLANIQDWTYKEGTFSASTARLKYAKEVRFWTYNNNRMAGIKLQDLTNENLDTITEYDCSGFCNNGTQWAYDNNGSIDYTSDTPKYSVSTYINSSNNTTNTASGTQYIYGNCELTTPQYLTVAFWCKPIAGYGNGTAQGQFSLTKNAIGASAGEDYSACPMNHRDGYIDMCTSTDVHKTMNISFTANEWHHYVIVYDGRYGRVYKDGVATGQTLDMGSVLSLKDMKGVVIGFSKAGGVWRSNKSYYSDFRIYATALSADDVKSLYQNCATIDPDGTIRGQIRS